MKGERGEELIELLRKVLYYKIAMWDTASMFERFAGIEIDTASDRLECACVGFDTAYDVWTAGASMIRRVLTDEQWEQALSATALKEAEQ